jgi:hypothetical protein
MAKKRREKSEEEELDFKLPKFDEEKFLKKEKRNVKTLFISFILGLVVSLISFGFWILLSGSEIRWYLILLFGFFCAPWIRYLFLNLNIDLEEFGRKGWFGTFATYFFTWLIVLIVLVNPPFYDEEAPRIELIALPGMQEPGGSIEIVAYILDNVALDRDKIEFELTYPNGTIENPEFSFEKNILKFSFENPENILGEFPFTLTVTDINGHTNRINSSFEYSADALEIISSIFKDIRSGDVITIKANEKISNENFRVYYKINDGNDINVDRADTDDKEKYETTSEYIGWSENSNLTVNLFAEVSYYFINIDENFTNTVEDTNTYNFTTGSDASIGTEPSLETDELSYNLPSPKGLPTTPGFEIITLLLSIIVAIIILKREKKKKK